MYEENVKMDCSGPKLSRFSRKFKILLYFSIFFTGFSSLMGLGAVQILIEFISGGMSAKDIERYSSVNSLLWDNMFYIIMIFCFISLLKIAFSKKPFSGIMAKCFYIIGLLLTAGAVFFPRLPSYIRPDLLIAPLTERYYWDGRPFIIGILIILFGAIIQFGTAYQQEIDHIV